MKPIYLLFTIAVFIIGCKSKTVVTPDEAEGPQIILSHGGGFTGQFKTFYLLENGQFFRDADLKNDSNKSVKLDKNTVKQIFENYKTLGLKEMKRDTPGNLTYSITIKDDEGENTIQWSKGQAGTEMLQVFYGNIMNVVKKKEKE